MTHTFVELHAIQTVPPSNINRDDTGSPKTALFGGTRRARVSSQSWKRAIRTEFAELLDPSLLGTRTKRVVALVADAMSHLDSSLERSEHVRLAADVIKAAGIALDTPKPKKEDNNDEAVVPESKYLLFLSQRQIEHLAQIALDSNAAGDVIDKKAAKAAADTDHSVDLALFGRMVADAKDLTLDATAQVAHAISVHAVDSEFDFYTAVDDVKKRDDSADAGAGMMGTVEFNSSTLYRYATVNVHGLRSSLGDGATTSDAVCAFVRAFVTSMPTGKQTTFANRTLPEAVVVRVRGDQPINLSAAFEEAVESDRHQGRLAQACQRLVSYAGEIDRAYGTSGVKTFVVRVGEATAALSGFGIEGSLDDVIKGVGEAVADELGDES